MRNGEPDEELFDQVIGRQIAQAVAGGRQLRAFGEMVALLASEGNARAAVRLEDLWNRLREAYGFSLFCAYPLSGLGPLSEEEFHSICGAHSRVLPAESYEASGATSEERLRMVAMLQQKAAALEVQVAERKRVEDALRRSERELAAFVENSSLGLHWAGPDGIILWANKADSEMLGYSLEEYLGRHVAEFHADAEVIADILARLHRGERVQNREARLKCKDGSTKIVHIDSSVLWEEGRFVHTQCFTRDITAQKREEEMSRQLAAIVEFSDDAIVSKNLDSIVTSWNQGAERLFGYAANEIIGKPVTLLIPEESSDEEPLILSRISRGEPIDHYETVRRRKDGTLVAVSLTVSPIKDRHGKIVGASKIARDITERKRAEQALQSAQAELAKANEELERRVRERTASLEEAIAHMEEFSYTISHDLRAPLRGMQSYSKALLDDFGELLKSEPEAIHYLKRIAENAARLDRMILALLTFSRVGRDEVRLEPVSLEKLVKDVVEHISELQPPFAEIRLGPLYDVLGHEPALAQAISNLLTNAAKFVAPGVTPKLHIWSERRQGEVRLWVEDNGIGIDPKFQHRLFTMFERIHPNLKYEGTGVGLAIVRKAVDRMGGRIGLESDGVQGSKFWIQLRAPQNPP
jgi:PAS domain S-box-containing protein